MANIPRKKKTTHPPRQYHRQKTDKFYLSKKWKAVRYTVLERDMHLCQACMEQGLIEKGNTVDHIVPRKFGGADYDLDNLQTLCESCHASKSSKERWQRKRQKDT